MLRILLLGAAALALLAVAVLLGVAIGETRLAPATVFQVLANQLLGARYPVDPIDQGIVWNYRLARALVAASCGAGLAISGVILQSLLRNALAEPYLLGISAGASTGAVLVSVAGLGAGAVSMTTGAFFGAVCAFALVALLAHAAGSGGLRNGAQIVLAGIAGSQLFNALTSLIITKSGSAEQARGIMFWLLGNLSGVRWSDTLLTAGVALAGMAVCAWHARALDAFTFGTESAAALGVPVRRLQLVLLLAAALITAVMVSIVGAIGFVGLVIPHAARFIVGVRHRRLIPVSALMGAVFLIAADVISRTLIPGQVLPIGVITALVGAPVFAAILLRGRGGRV
ncbi:FecCD family ABC transporter permease [Comamonas endophytica]|uniref:Iron ABC transporter permease n=1 Tax=Comamonas endophytica TaxID=2949090 RepID=A0ABY6GH96_9BURK|nr:iron ABC transporter permease [Acidovorax sp. 5MLIR]MCD2514448.1 iron ABC transporter permease [Acidovorax sp. D4N7]UYG53737.1 iron ABC transporter permease [Acidovorax sp. 5MLIR]